MKYKVGDKVRIKSLDWYNENKDNNHEIKFENGTFTTLKSTFLGQIMTIEEITLEKQYILMEDRYKTLWTDEMIEGLVEEETKFGTASNPLEPKSNANCITRERVDELNKLATKIDEELSYGNPYVWECPEGYQFTDENGNVINATKIVLEKKKKEYPKTYEECWYLLKHDPNFDKIEGYKSDILSAFQKLLICRNAYWKIAGEEMGLGKPWEPDYSGTFEDGTPIKYVIYNTGTHIVKERKSSPNHILSFPTEEMQDAFKENFDKDLETCKEFL